MDNEPRDLGTVGIIAARAECAGVEEKNGTAWATFFVPIANRAPTDSLLIVDNRPTTIEAARAAQDFSTKYFQTRKAQKPELEEERVRLLRAARQALHTGVADGLLRRSVITGGKREKITIALFETDATDAERIVALVHSVGPWQHTPWRQEDDRPLSIMKQGSLHHLHVVITDDVSRVWQLDPNGPACFTVSLNNGLEITSYEPQETKRFAETVVEKTSPPAKPPVEEPAADTGVDDDDPKNIDRLGLKSSDIDKLKKLKIETPRQLAKRIKADNDNAKKLANKSGAPKTRLLKAAAIANSDTAW